MPATNLLAKNVRGLGRFLTASGTGCVHAAGRVLASPSRRVALAVFIGVFPLTGAIAALTSGPSDLEKNLRNSQTLIETPLSVPVFEGAMSEASSADIAFINTTALRRGDTLSTVFARLGIDDEAAGRFIRQQKTGQTLFSTPKSVHLQAKVSSDRKLQSLKIFVEDKNPSSKNTLTSIVRNSKGGFSATESGFTFEVQQNMSAGSVTTTLEEAAREQGVPQSVIDQMPIAFEKFFSLGNQLTPGDSFRVIYEELFLGGEFVRAGKILAMAVNHKGRDVESFWAADGTPSGNFYALDGKTSRQTFIRVPVEGSHLTSPFMALRKHPITGVLRPHLGIDYAALKGNRIYAASDGVVTRRAYNEKGYGNYLIITHDANRSTVYGHMSKIAPGINEGTRVKKGQVIGYVGMTGLATGPHLHYELRFAGNQINPLKAPYPEKDVLTSSEHARLLSAARLLTARLAMLNRLQTTQPAAPAEASEVRIMNGAPKAP